MAEHIIRRVRESATEESKAAVLYAAAEFTRPLMGSSAATIIIFAPLAFLSESGFMPTTDEGGFIIDYRAPPGTSMTETDRLVRQVEAILQATPEVQTYSRRTGLGLGGDLNEANQGDFFVRLKTGPRRDVEEIMADVRTKVEHTIPGLTIETAQLMEDLIGDLTSVPQPIEIKLFSDDPATLQRLGPAVADAIASVPDVVEVKNGITPAVSNFYHDERCLNENLSCRG
jgi:multidrug efflux pump subunit AcrB